MDERKAAVVCRNCNRTRVTKEMYHARFKDVWDVTFLDTFMCHSCKEAFEWGTAYPKDDAGGHYVEFEHVDGKEIKRHEMDEWHAYRNALACSLTGITGKSRQACTSIANVVIDKRILPPLGESRQTYRDCGLLARLYTRVMEDNESAYSHAGSNANEVFLAVLNNDADIERLREEARGGL